MSNSSKPSAIRLFGVRHNNLKNFDLDIPLGQITVITGLSGSGKSSLAFDTLFAEGQRRYIETFSPYARQFFDRMDKPQVDRIEGIPPAIAIEQRNAVRTTRSTVGTMTELCDYMKLLWPHVARLHCQQCSQPVRKEPPQVVWGVLQMESGKRNVECLITFTLPLSEKLSLKDSLDLIAKQGYQRVLIGTDIVRVEDALSHLVPALSHLIIVQDRLKLITANRARFVEACEQAYHFGKGKLTIYPLGTDAKPDTQHPKRYSKGFHCATCDLDYREPSSALFSFNNPVGACPACKGFGRVISIDYDLAIPDRWKTLAEGCVKPWLVGHGLESQRDLMTFCKKRRVETDVPFNELSKQTQGWVLDGDDGYDSKDPDNSWPKKWYGVKGYFRWLESKSYKMHVRVLLSRYRAYTLCPTCEGRRLKPEALLYRLPFASGPVIIEQLISNQTAGKGSGTATGSLGADLPCTDCSLADFYALSVEAALRLIEHLVAQYSPKASDPLGLAFNEVRSRLRYLVEVGLGYLTLDRPTRTLSGGETERVNLTTCLGTRLVNTLFVLDEPSVGLHPRDTARLVHILEQLRDTGNTVVVVEHEASIMRAANQVVDLGPGQGEKGGEVVFCGSVKELLKSERSLTGHYLSGRKQIEVRPRRQVLKCGVATPLLPSQDAVALNEATIPYRVTDASPVFAVPTLKISNAARHNLKHLSVQIPLGRFVALTGVSGSGKTTLVREVLLPALQARLKTDAANAKASDRLISDESGGDEQSPVAASPSSISGTEHLREVVLVDQSSLGKTPRSNPVVYIGAFDDVRELFAQTDLAKQRGLSGSAFSFNSGVGQCERCRGAGFEKIEMQFLSDIFIQCPECNGRRYRGHILEVKLRADAREWSIADMLEATVDDSLAFLGNFHHVPAGRRSLARLKLLQEVGLGYLRLGQPINTLSGGESQRLKLVSHLAESAAAQPGVSDGTRVGAKNTREEVEQWLAAKRAARLADRLTLTPHPSLSSSGGVGGFRPGEGESVEADSVGGSTPDKGTLFLFDEPTTGLHFDDVRVLLQVFQRIVDAGHSVVVIEHNLDVIKCADWVIDLGPDAGERGGQLVAAGTPEEVARCEGSHTGRFLREVLGTFDEVSGKGAPAAHSPAYSLTHSRLGPKPRSSTTTDDTIALRGAREHNLKNLSLDIPRGKFVVVTGVSGSGKSTLAFDLLFAEGQRRFLDSMSAYARQFVEQLARPDVDLITGLPPTVSIEQRTTRGGGKSTVATVTEVYHFFRLLFARLGIQYCPACQLPVEAQTRDALATGLKKELKQRGDLLLLAPVVRNRKGFHTDVAEWAASHGYKEVRADGKLHDTSKPFRLDRFKEHDVEIVVGVLDRRRKADAGTRSPQQLIEETLDLGKGTLFALDNHGKVTIHSTERACPKCARSFSPLDPKNFSYNSAQGWCPRCRGFGELFYIPEVERGANADSIEESWWRWANEREVCPECNGARLKAESRAVRLAISGSQSPTIDTFSQFAVASAHKLFCKLKFKGREAAIARDILPEIVERLRFLDEVGLGYLQLGRAVTTLSGGEAQRIRLAAQLGSNLSGVLYVLDEPTIGLHARDNEQLLGALHQLQSRGNSLVVVEHDEETMRRADYIIDLGPGAGVHGGTVVASGTLSELMRNKDSITGSLLLAQDTRTHPARGQRRSVIADVGRRKQEASSKVSVRLRTSAAVDWLTLHDASVNNLKDLEVRFPLSRFVVVTGVSGSGKSSMVRECLLPAVEGAVKRQTRNPKPGTRNNARVTGFESLKAVYEVDQSPIGRTPRSTPATYVGFFDDIRALFAQTPEARMRGYSASRFSFNSAQGRCPECEGSGVIKLEMNFLPPAFVKCESCDGKRFSRETLDIQYAGKNIAQVLDMSVEEAIQFFAAHRKILRPLQALHDTGLDYIKLGQTSPTLSGGEAQRVKLVTHLLTGLKESRELPLPNLPARGSVDSRIMKRNLFILEEPTIGLHMSDVHRLVEVLQRLVDAGHSVIVIEHNLDLIAEADWVIDLGPEGGEAGGELVAEGTPEQIARNKRSHTGRFLRSVLRIP
jgi:excinuclease ABC subunit A